MPHARSFVVLITAAVIPAWSLAGCTDNCRSLAERICDFYIGGLSRAGSVSDCMEKVKVSFDKITGDVRWEDEYRCGEYLDSCTSRSIEVGDCHDCGLSNCSQLSPCITIWHQACDCVMEDDPATLDVCHEAAASAGFTADQDQSCGHQYRDSCTCDAIRRGDCAPCGWSPCGPFSPCLANWRTACECAWGEFPDKLARCHASMEVTGGTIPAANPYNWAHASPFAADEDARCAASRDTCTCQDLASGACERCGFSEEHCGYFSPCKVLGYRLCSCAVAGKDAQAVCGDFIDRNGYDGADNASCSELADRCTCDTLRDSANCPGSMIYLFSPCRQLSAELCACPKVAADQRTQCNVALATAGFTSDDETACEVMRTTCTCDALANGQGCPDVLIGRFTTLTQK